MPVQRSQAHSNDHSNTNATFSRWFSPSSWLSIFNSQLDAWYNTAAQTYSMARRYVVDEPMAYSPELYLPQDAKLSIDIAQAYRNRIKEIKKGLKQKQFSPDWITTLRSLFELVEQGKLSVLAYAEGLEKLENANNRLPNELKSWIHHARTELGKLKQNQTWATQQFRLSIYEGLMEVIHNKIMPQEWLEQLDNFEKFVPEELFELVMVNVEHFYHRYCENVEQHKFSQYPVPASAYRELFSSIENQFAEEQAENKKVKEAQEDNENNVLPEDESDYSLMTPIKQAFNWISNHPCRNRHLLGLTATAIL